MDSFVALYLFLLAGVAGYLLIANVPSLLHTPLLSGFSFIHGIVLVGAVVALGHAEGVLQTIIGFVGVTAATANAVGGYVVTDRILAMFELSVKRNRIRVENEKKRLAARNASTVVDRDAVVDTASSADVRRDAGEGDGSNDA